MNTSRASQIPQVGRIGRENLVAVTGEAHERRVDGIRSAASAKQYSRTLTKAVVQWPDVDPYKKPRYLDLASPSPAPDLGDHAAVGQR